SMLKSEGQDQEMPSITLEELENLQFLCEMVDIPDEVFSTLTALRTELKDEGVRPSDRRFKQSLSILQAKALMEQRQEEEIKDILKGVKQDPSTEQVLEANQKFKSMLEELKQLSNSHPNREDIGSAIKEIQENQKNITESILEPIEE